MREWTPAAKDEFERYCESARDKLTAEGADPAEVFDDLKGHVEREGAAAGLQVLTRDDLRQILGRLGPMGDRQASPAPPLGPAPVPPVRKRYWFQWTFGVVLPVISLVVEIASGWCASVFFDPLPTPGHLVLACLVPASSAWLLRQLGSGSAERPDRMALASGALLGIALLFTIPFLLLLPIAVIALVFFGLGLLPLTPPLAFLASLRIAARVRRETRSTVPLGRLQAYGFGAAVLAFVAADLPRTTTNLGLRLANAETEAGRQRGVRLLRALGSSDQLLRACYDRTGVPMDLVSFALQPLFPDSVTPAQARAVFYRVTGKAFNTVAPPRVRTVRGGDPTAVWDFDQASANVGAPLHGLALAGSRLDGSIDTDAALAYVEWTLEFKNDGGRPAEARAHVELPPGAVVSRVTLWINGEEREAAFGGRGQVRQAYEQVVTARRDPILVTTSGPDRVLVQCFPVNPGVVMKARVGVTAPLMLDDPSDGLLLLPRFVERNFAVRDETTHAVWIETKGRFAPAHASYALEPLAAGGHALRASLSDTALAGEARRIAILRDPVRVEAWAPGEGSAPAIRQTLRRRATTPVQRLVVVLDGSRGATSASGPLAVALERLPPSLEVAVVLASDAPTVIAPPEAGGKRAALAVSKAEFAGGTDNVPALVQGWDLAQGSPMGVVLWVHGPQPELLSSTSMLAQRWARRPAGPRLLAFPIEDGANKVLEELGDVSPVESWARRAELPADLAAAVERASGRVAPFEAVREPSTSAPDLSAAPTSAHIRRLWAVEQVRAFLARGDAPSRKAALELAVANRLVTPVSGAVVLETQVQYDQAGLQPAGPETIPTIPEPETWLLLVVVACTCVWLARSRARERAA